MHIIEPSKDILVYNTYDVVVCGGGIAGVSAAIASARSGAKTLIIEREYALGGLATLGLVVVYLPLCDGKGKQVSYGISEELLRLSIEYGAEGKYPNAWLDKEYQEERKNQRFEVQFNGNLFAISLEKKLIQEGIDILYGTTVCGADMHEGILNAVIIENKTGRQAVIAKSFVDASGDADLFHFVGEDTVINESGNPLAAWYCETIDGEYRLRINGVPDLVRPGEEAERISDKRYIGIDGKELTEMMIESHSSILKEFLKKGTDSSKHALSTIATIPMIRMTRRIKGNCEMRITDEFRYYSDSVGVVSNWKYAGPIYEVPFSALYGTKCRNIIAAGRIIAADDGMWDVMRVIPACAVTGEAAGTAAAMGTDFSKIDILALQNKLRGNGVYIHINDLP